MSSIHKAIVDSTLGRAYTDAKIIDHWFHDAPVAESQEVHVDNVNDDGRVPNYYYTIQGNLIPGRFTHTESRYNVSPFLFVSPAGARCITKQHRPPAYCTQCFFCASESLHNATTCPPQCYAIQVLTMTSTHSNHRAPKLCPAVRPRHPGPLARRARHTAWAHTPAIRLS